MSTSAVIMTSVRRRTWDVGTYFGLFRDPVPLFRRITKNKQTNKENKTKEKGLVLKTSVKERTVSYEAV